MGDRTTVYLTLHGVVHARHLLKIYDALTQENMVFGDGSDHLSRDGFKEWAKEEAPNATFYATEVNYGNIEGLELVLQTLGVAYSANHEGGGGYEVEYWSFTPGRGQMTAATSPDGVPAVQVSEIMAILDSETPDKLATLRARCEAEQEAIGENLPPFSIDPGDGIEVEWAKSVALDALGVEP